MTRHLRRAVLLTAAAITSLAAGGCGGAPAPVPPTGSGSPGTASPSATAPATTSAPATPATPAQDAGLPAGYLPLFPFAGLAGVRAWQASYASGGHQPWHLSPDSTATAFAAYLGYAGVTEVARSTVNGPDAHVAVGIRLPNGSIGTAAVVHLLRFGSGTDAPWEVVGTDDTTFTMDRPAYGTTVSSPVTAGGTITGVDENIRVTVRALSAGGPAGGYCCQPAGGTSSPWSARVTFSASPGEVITIAASTGGHVAAVERFAVTGARASLASQPRPRDRGGTGGTGAGPGGPGRDRGDRGDRGGR